MATNAGTETPSAGNNVGSRSRTPLELLSFVVSLLSLAVAVLAGVLSYQAWIRPVPADPTQVPTFGTAGAPAVVHSADDANAFFSFIEDNAGRKVRLNLVLDPEYYGIEPTDTLSEAGFAVPSGACPDRRRPLREVDPYACEFLLLEVLQLSDERRGMYLEHGQWELNGYFASNGYVNIFMGYHVYSIVPLTPIEAVS